MRDAVIFDMDGLLLDTERVALQAFKETCVFLDITFDHSVYNRCIGCTMETTKTILEDNIPSFPTKAFINYWNSLYHERAIENPVPVKSGVTEFLTWLERSNIPCAVATSTGLKNAKRKLTNANLIGHFSVLMTGDQVSRGKPHPEIYLTAAKKLGFSPQNCLALEDSDNGVR
ncbi:MAG: HAD family phosphatase, partial [Sneathiella sp.]|nr:HAD family phosphatase [Sneathiella sp.]